MKYKVTIAVLIMVLGLTLHGQVVPFKIKEAVENIANLRSSGIKKTRELQDFYQITGYQSAWIGSHPNKLKQLLLIVQQAENLGLEHKDYPLSFLNSILEKKLMLKSTDDSIEAELKITDAALHFFSNVAYGNARQHTGYNGLEYEPACLSIAALLSGSLQAGDLMSLLEKLEPVTAAYHLMKEKLMIFNKKITDPSFKEAIVRSSKVSTDNKPLLTKLYHLCITDSIDQTLSQKELVEKVKQAQSLFSLLNDGVLRTTAISELNVPLRKRISELKTAINYLRWMNCKLQSAKTVVVNIPSADLSVYEKGNATFYSRIVVGARVSPTPVFNSLINEVILYPYWNVPYSIAVNEMLPRIRFNPGYLETHNYQLLKDGKIVNPYSINWNEVGPGNFPYSIRQSTGCDNALGIIKLNFYNPYTVYLHDTPSKSLFSMNKRYFSHGCMRVEKAVELGRLLLDKGLPLYESIVVQDCLDRQSPIVIPADKPMALFVIYSTAWIAENGQVAFFENIYNK